MELGETVQDAAIRETREEIGCRVRLDGPARLYSYDDAAVVTVVYDARVVGAGPRAGVESLEVQVFAADEIPWDRLAFRSTYHALRDWAERRKS
jgi:ADP-ribose pyrophosphatase YjhB (NUDIX family)